MAKQSEPPPAPLEPPQMSQQVTLVQAGYVLAQGLFKAGRIYDAAIVDGLTRVIQQQSLNLLDASRMAPPPAAAPKASGGARRGRPPGSKTKKPGVSSEDRDDPRQTAHPAVAAIVHARTDNGGAACGKPVGPLDMTTTQYGMVNCPDPTCREALR